MGINNFLCFFTSIQILHLTVDNLPFKPTNFLPNPIVLKSLIKFPFRLPSLLVITMIWENISFCPNISNIKGKNYIHWHIKGFKVLLQCGNWTMPWWLLSCKHIDNMFGKILEIFFWWRFQRNHTSNCKHNIKVHQTSTCTKCRMQRKIYKGFVVDNRLVVTFQACNVTQQHSIHKRQ